MMELLERARLAQRRVELDRAELAVREAREIVEAHTRRLQPEIATDEAAGAPRAMTPYCQDAYPLEGCLLAVEVKRGRFAMTIFAPNGALMESWRGVETPAAIGRMVREWCEGLVPRWRPRD